MHVFIFLIGLLVLLLMSFENSVYVLVTNHLSDNVACKCSLLLYSLPLHSNSFSLRKKFNFDEVQPTDFSFYGS